jgi:hypothetical protein
VKYRYGFLRKSSFSCWLRGVNHHARQSSHISHITHENTSYPLILKAEIDTYTNHKQPHSQPNLRPLLLTEMSPEGIHEHQ